MITILLVAALTQDAYETWKAHKPGTVAEFETAGQGLTIKTTKTLESRSSERVVLRVETRQRFGEVETVASGTEVVRKGQGWSCVACSKPWSDHKDAGSWTEETAKVGVKDVACRVWQSPEKNCLGAEITKTRVWTSADVPGGLVRLETDTTVVRLVKFERPADKPAARRPPDAYESWGDCKEGSSVEFEMEASGMKLFMTKTLSKIGELEHTLRTEMKMTVGGNESVTPGEEKVPKPRESGGDGECPMCRKAFSEHKDEGNWSDETLKIDGKDVKCLVYESAAKMCDGNDMPRSKMWYSSEVPGGFVRMETDQMTMKLVKFAKK